MPPDRTSYIAAFAFNQAPWLIGLSQQGGGEWFKAEDDAWNVAIDDDETMKVADFWQKLIDEDLVKIEADFSSEWNADIQNGNIASWISGSWADAIVRGTAPDTAGKLGRRPDAAVGRGRERLGDLGRRLGQRRAQGHRPPRRGRGVRPLAEQRPRSVSILTSIGAGWPAITDLESIASLQDDPEVFAFYGGQDIWDVFAESDAAVASTWKWPPLSQTLFAYLTDNVKAAVESGTPLADGVRADAGRLRRRTRRQGHRRRRMTTAAGRRPGPPPQRSPHRYGFGRTDVTLSTTAPRGAARPAATQEPTPAPVAAAPARSSGCSSCRSSLMFAAFFVAPIVFAIGRQPLLPASRSGPGLGAPSREFVFLDNYIAALTDPSFLASLLQAPRLLGDRGAADGRHRARPRPAARCRRRARAPRLFRVTFFMPYGVPGVIAALLWGFLYVPATSPVLQLLGGLGIDINPLSSDAVLFAIANIALWGFAGYNMLILIAALDSIPSELYEAAKLDGAGEWRMIWSIKLPLIRPSIVLITLFTIIGTLQLFVEPLVLRPLTTAISSDYTPNLAAYNQAFAQGNPNLAAAMAVIVALLAFVFSALFIRIVNRKGNRAW